MSSVPDPTKEYPVSLDRRNVTHRIVRYCKREEHGKVIPEGVDGTTYIVVYWEVTCACGTVFQKDTELLASAAYLDHLPKPLEEG